MSLPLNKIYLMDCLEGMKLLDDQSISAIICDLPYGTTRCEWDSIIPFEPMWEQYLRVIKPNHPIVLFASQPFTSRLIMSNIEMFRYTWVWRKGRASGFVNVNLRPMKGHEDICVFSQYPIANGVDVPHSPYYPQGIHKIDKIIKKKHHTGTPSVNYSYKGKPLEWIQEYTGYPTSVIEFSNHNGGLIHPTQKPVSLIEYLVKTYTQENELVLDNCMGSGTTAVACMRTNRQFVGFEMNPEYFHKANERIESIQSTESLTDLFEPV